MEHMDSKVTKEMMGYKAIKEMLAMTVHKDSRAIKDLQEMMDYKAPRVSKAIKDPVSMAYRSGFLRLLPISGPLERTL
jgi:hypothetical protein